uniref:Uncharacterized protein n=1 Tax=Arundo donax TaxID=35708 RepID=A0A0A9EUD5_ARUDO
MKSRIQSDDRGDAYSNYLGADASSKSTRGRIIESILVLAIYRTHLRRIRSSSQSLLHAYLRAARPGLERTAMATGRRARKAPSATAMALLHPSMSRKPASHHRRSARPDTAGFVVGASHSSSSTATSVSAPRSVSSPPPPPTLVHSAKAATKGSLLAPRPEDATGALPLARRRRWRRADGRSGGGSGRGASAEESARPLRNEFLGTPGWRSHEKGTTEVVLVRGDGAGDGDGQKKDAVDTEEEEEDEEDEEVRWRPR